MSSSFFDLCPDILFDLFEYFSLNELYDTFIDLIPYLLTLLNQSHRKFHIDQNVDKDFWYKILPKINSKQIISIDNAPYLIKNFSQFSYLRSLNMSFQSIFNFDQFHYLIHLEQLSIQISDINIENSLWLSHILLLPKLEKLKIDLLDSKNILTPQKAISFNKLSYQSLTIKYLDIKIPMSWQSILLFLTHFPNLKTFRATLYQLNSFIDNLYPSIYLTSLKVLDLQGYFHHMSSLITTIYSSMPNLTHCRLIAMNVTNDDAFRMKSAFTWKYLFQYCQYLRQVKIHLIMSIEINNHFNIRSMKELIRTFNNDLFCEKHHFQMEQLSINRGYVTLTADYNMKKS